MTMFHLPFEIAIQILSRLPVKSLLRFKSVCKTWHDLIKTPDFISRHLLTHSTLNHTPPLENCFILVTENDEISLIYNDGFNGPINLDFPFLDIRNYRRTSGNGGENYFSIGGMCNGLVCVSLSCFGYRLFLCNPSTRQYREIPNSERKDQNLYSDQVSFGFGFHPSANDYKLIRIVHYSAPPIREYNIRADLYVMSTDTWTEIDFNKLSLFLGETNEWGLYDSIVQIGVSSATALNGVFYWPAHVVPTDQVVVMSFDMGNEVFRRIRTPECLHKIRNLTIQELDDKIALVVSPDERSFDVWVLNENESCWTNQIKVGPFPRIASVVGYEVDCDITAVGGGKNGELLVTEHKYSGELKLYSYDTKTRETIDLYCGQVPYLSCVHLCEGTLLPVMQANEIVLNK